MADQENNNRRFLFYSSIRAARRRRLMAQSYICHHLLMKRNTIVLCTIILLLLSARENATTLEHPRSCRRLTRNGGWFDLVFDSYSNKRFKQTFRVSKATFNIILENIKHDLQRHTVTETPISPQMRLGICLYRLGRGDYNYTVAELAGVGVSTVSAIVREVSESIISNMWANYVSSHFPNDEAQFKEKMLDMEELWQFPCCWSAVDGCHIPIKCPAGGSESCKEYHNFKNFYSIVLMGMVDARYRFIWASCGFPGNSHDSIILQSTDLWDSILQGDVVPDIAKNVDGVDVFPLILGDSAFPFRPFLMKPYTNANLRPKQRYFNYRLSRARMTTEGAYGQLKGRWRVLQRKCESDPETVRTFTMACIVLHNICIARGDSMSKKMDLTIDAVTGERRERDKIRNLLHMNMSQPVRNTNQEAAAIRSCLAHKLWREKEGHGVE